MKTPKFFYKKISLIAFLLIPFSFIFWILSIVRNLLTKSTKLENKIVICVGNAMVGGSGKTPTCIFLAELLQEKGYDVCFLTKGYGRKTKGFQKIEPNQASIEVGDEPLILIKTSPVYVFSKYKEIVENITQIKEKIIIMDDGMQNPYIKKDITFLVVDGIFKFGTELLLPAGPLRESVKSAVNKSSAVIYINAEDPVCNTSKPQFFLQTTFENIPNKSFKYLAFSGLALNKKFLYTLKHLHLKVEKFYEFEDHHIYTEAEIEKIIKIASAENLKIVTTEKDIVKIPPQFLPSISFIKLKITSNKREAISKFICNSVSRL